MVKGQDVKKNKKATQSSRNVKKKTLQTSTLSSEELLEQILIKNKEKKARKKATTTVKKPGVKRVAKPKVVKPEVDNGLLLEQILEKNKAKRKKKAESRKKKTSGRLLVDSNTVENKIVQEIIKIQEQEKQEQEENLIITKEINLQEYLKEQNELPPREDFLKLEDELYPSQVEEKKEDLREKYKDFKEERKAQRRAKYQKEIEEKIERRRNKKQRKLKKRLPNIEKDKTKVEYKYYKVIFPGALVAFACVVLVISLVVLLSNKTSNAVQLEQIDVSSNLDLGAVKALQEICLVEGTNENDNNEEIKRLTGELDEMLSGYNASVYYYDLNRGFTYSYKADTKYYAASVVKLIPAMYVYEKANNGEIDLDKTITYSSNYNYSDSVYFDTIKYGTKISLRNVIKYAIIYSDNSAYMMLINYVGANTLKDYAKSIGVNSYMDTDRFGHINANEGLNIIKRLNSLLSQGTVVTNELKNYLLESDNNYLVLEDYDVKAATKYGESYPNFHNIGIVYDDYPYAVVILTTDMNKKHEEEIKAINKKIYELHRKYNLNRIVSCEKISK